MTSMLGDISLPQLIVVWHFNQQAALCSAASLVSSYGIFPLPTCQGNAADSSSTVMSLEAELEFAGQFLADETASVFIMSPKTTMCALDGKGELEIGCGFSIRSESTGLYSGNKEAAGTASSKSHQTKAALGDQVQ